MNKETKEKILWFIVISNTTVNVITFFIIMNILESLRIIHDILDLINMLL